MGAAPDESTGLDFERLYDYRFRRIDQTSRRAVWRVIAADVYRRLGEPRRVLEPGAGRCEFINAIPADERWIVDTIESSRQCADPGVRSIVGDARHVELPIGHFDGIFVSNLLEHLPSQDEVGTLLGRLHGAMDDGGRIAILGPNFRYCAKQYFDCADHTIALTHVAVEEHLFAAGFTVERSVPKYLPYSFRGRLPRAPFLVTWYLKFPLAWWLMGKQFLVIGRKT